MAAHTCFTGQDARPLQIQLPHTLLPTTRGQIIQAGYVWNMIDPVLLPGGNTNMLLILIRESHAVIISGHHSVLSPPHDVAIYSAPIS